MRHLSVIALCLLTACAAPPAAEVSKGAPLDTSVGARLPAMQGFAAGGVTAPQRSNREMARDFLDLEFRMESGRALPTFTRFDGPITVALHGDVPATAPAELARLINRFRNEAGLDVRAVTSGEQASVTIEFQPRRALMQVVPTAACFVVPNVSSFADYKAKRGGQDVEWIHMTRREHVAIFVPADTSPQEVRDCLHEELAQAMGPLNDLYHLPDSVFNDDNFHTALTGFDMLMLRLHYAPEMQNGMNEAEAAKVIPSLLARMNPAGENRGGELKNVAPRSWVNQVETAFGVRGSVGARKRAAEKMLSMAMAQGWRDTRLALSYYAVGRNNVTSNPEVAVKAFAEAGRIYRSLPGGELHAAHVDMQLAAIALSSGQPDQAIAFVDRAIPVVKQGENAALLATLMLIKAEALEGEGRVAEAKALRLDSLGWARYGFGSEQQMRARMSEVASLGARGRRG